MTEITVVVPSWNDADFLRACLDALARQTRPADELIVVDNGSTDATRAVALAAGARVIDEPLRGIWPASAAGFDAARGDVIARLDADSLPPRDWLERIAAHFDAPGAPTAVTGAGVFYGGNAVVRAIARHLYIGGYLWSMGILLGHPPLFGSNFAIRREAWLRVRGAVHRDRDDLHDDLDLSWWLEPDMTVVLDRMLLVAVSARPFESAASLGRRLRMAFRTIGVDWRALPPAERRAARAAHGVSVVRE